MGFREMISNEKITLDEADAKIFLRKYTAWEFLRMAINKNKGKSKQELFVTLSKMDDIMDDIVNIITITRSAEFDEENELPNRVLKMLLNRGYFKFGELNGAP